MNCQTHPDVAAVAFCRTCGRPLCETCQHSVQGTIVCEEHAPQPVVRPTPASPPTPAPGEVSPGLAFVLGLIPGVGAIYNGQYAKGVVHVVIFGLLISLVSSGATDGFEALFGMLIAIWYFYMPFEAYHTASRRLAGQHVDEFSSIFPLKSRHAGLPIGPVFLIALGVLFLLITMDILQFRQIARYWPVALIVLGGYMLYSRITGGPQGIEDVQQEAQHGQH